MEHKDTNIYDIIKWAKNIEGQRICEDEELVKVDIKEMFNAINTEKLLNNGKEQYKI